MKLDQITSGTFGPLFRQLVAGYQHRMPEAWLEQSQRVYFGAVRGFSTRVVEQAITALIHEPVRYFPKAGQLRHACLGIVRGEERAQARQYHQGSDPDQCPSCHTRFEWRTWLTTRKTRSDPRTTELEYELRDGTVVQLLSASRMLCECGFRAVISQRQTHELRAMVQWGDSDDAAAELARRGQRPEVQTELPVPRSSPSPDELEARKAHWREAARAAETVG